MDKGWGGGKGEGGIEEWGGWKDQGMGENILVCQEFFWLSKWLGVGDRLSIEFKIEVIFVKKF